MKLSIRFVTVIIIILICVCYYCYTKSKKEQFRRYEPWMDWDSDLSVNMASLNIPYVPQNIPRTTAIQPNIYPFKIVTAQYLKDKGYLTSPDFVYSGSRGMNIYMYAVTIPKNSKWAAMGDLFIPSSSSSPDLSNIPVCLVANRRPFSIPVEKGNLNWISDSWKCSHPDQLGWWCIQNKPVNYQLIGDMISRYAKGDNPLSPDQRNGMEVAINLVHSYWVRQLGYYDRDTRWAVGDASGSGCGADHWFYMSSPFFTMCINSSNTGWRNFNRPFFDIVPSEPLQTIDWFIELQRTNNVISTYYTYVYNHIYLKSEYGGQYLGKLVANDSSTIIPYDDVADTYLPARDIRTSIAFFGQPPQTTSNWINEFKLKDPGAQSLGDRLIISGQSVFIRPPQYFTLQNSQTGRCVHPYGGSDNPGEGTPLVYHSDNCGDNPPPDKLVMYQDNNGMIRLKNSACVGGYPYLKYTYKYCVPPEGVIPNQGTDTCESSNPLGGVCPDVLHSQNGYFRFVVQLDGNLVIYDVYNNVIWNSGTQNVGLSKLIMQPDGNLVLYTKNNNSAVWATNTYNWGYPGYKLVMQNDGNLVVYDSKQNVLWQTNTALPIPQPFDIGTNGLIKNRVTGKCVTPDGGMANQTTSLRYHNLCTAGSFFTKKDLPQEQDQYIGYVDDAHVGLIRMSDGKWIPIGDAFTLIAGPGYKEGFDFLGIGGAIVSAAETVAQGTMDLYNKAKSGIMTATDWVEARARDVVAFTQAAALSVSSWAKNMSESVLYWAKNTGLSIVKNLIDIGNKIGSFARDVANKIANTAKNTVNIIKENVYDKGLKVGGLLIADATTQAANAVKDAAVQAINLLASLPTLARQALEKAINWIRKQASYVWDKIGGPVGVLLNIILQGAPCEYYVSRKISGLEAVKAIEPPVIPNVRDAMLQLIESAISVASAGILTPLIAVIMPIVQQFSDLNEKIDGLLSDLFHQDFMVTAITTVADPIINNVMGKGCSIFDSPDTSDIPITSDDDFDDDEEVDDSAFADL